MWVPVPGSLVNHMSGHPGNQQEAWSVSERVVPALIRPLGWTLSFYPTHERLGAARSRV